MGRVADGVGKPDAGDVAVSSGVVAEVVGVLVSPPEKSVGDAVGVNDRVGESSGEAGVWRLAPSAADVGWLHRRINPSKGETSSKTSIIRRAKDHPAVPRLRGIARSEAGFCGGRFINGLIGDGQ